MPLNLRALAARDLETTIEGEFGIPVTLFTPDGQRITQTVDGRPLKGQVLWSQPSVNPETGEQAAAYAPVVVLRRASLSRIPATGEKWGVLIPDGPREGAAETSYLLDASYAVEGGKSLGKVRLPLVRAEEASP
ncbi:MAG: hypothetical protein LBK08_10370 [Treponema sp.]|nr:hypothetical protein [Treponema sp.]